MEIRFGDCALDDQSRQLRRKSEAVELSPKAYDLLQLLLEARPRALSKSEMLQRLWPDTFVVEANLSNLIAEVRTAIGDSAREPRFIRTVHGFGYAFSGVVESEPPAPRGDKRIARFWLVYGNSKIQLADGEHLIGRNPDSIVPIESRKVSRNHAVIRVAGEEATLVDLGSRNGTFLDGRQIAAPVKLEHRNRIQVGPVVLGFRDALLGSSTEMDIPIERRPPAGD
jgi:DNA-binding winged helix-turn-helix (wHTH) protein